MSTISDVITASRALLQDSRTPYRYEDARLIETLNGALREAFRLRPDLFLELDYVIPEYTTSDTAEDLPIEEQFFNPLVEFVTGFTELSDDEFTLDGRAASLLAAFKHQLIGGGV